MRISVAMCTFNGAKFLPHQLASIVAQTRLPNEMIVCDDGLTDATLQILEKFASSAGFPVRIHCNERNLGSTKNFEQAIGLCTGDVIALADQDDCWLPFKLAVIEEVFVRFSEIGLVFSDAILVDEFDEPIGCSLWESVRFAGARRRRMDGCGAVPVVSAVPSPSPALRATSLGGRGDGFASPLPPGEVARRAGEGFFATTSKGNPTRTAFSELLKRPVVTGATMAFRSQFRDLILPIPRSWIHDEWIALLVAATSRIHAICEPLMQYRRHSQNQVGVSGATVAERTQRSLARSFSEFGARSEAFGHLRHRIAERLPESPELLAQIDGKIRHFRTRADLPESRLFRLPTVLREVMMGRYSHYSGTVLSSIRDLVIRR